MSDATTPATPQTLAVWTDPGCPWAWETSRWLRELRDRGEFTIEWHLFSLEINTAGLQMPFHEAADRYGEALTAMALARREGGHPALEAYYVALGAIVHDEAEPISRDVVIRAADTADMPGLVDRAVSDSSLADAIVQEYRDARELDIFGVPSLRLGDAPPIYGPILPRAPSGAEALEWWEHISWLIERDDLYELKRWPRGRRPGSSFTSP